MRIAAVLLMSMIACGSSDPTPGDGDGDGDGDGGSGSDSPFAAQVMSPACAPNDAPALRLTLAGEIDPAACAATDSTASLVITVYTRDISPPATFDLGLSEGDASSCPAGDGPCQFPRSGAITFETYEPDVAASGSFSIDLGSELLEGSFEVDACVPETPIRCGLSP